MKFFILNNNDKESDKEIITSSLKKNEEVIKQKIKSTKEFFDEMNIYEMHSESECSEDEDIHALIIISLIDRFNIIEVEPDENCFFRVLSRS